MPIIKFKERHIVIERAKFFNYAPSAVELGHLGVKNNTLGQFEPDEVIDEIATHAEAKQYDTKISFIAIKKGGGGGKLDFVEPTDAFKVGVKVSGGSVKVVIGEAKVYSVPSRPIKEAIQNKEKYQKIVAGSKRVAVVDKIVVAETYLEYSVSEFNLKIKGKASIAEFIRAELEAGGEVASRTTASISKGTVLGYALQHVWIEKGEVKMKRDNPGLAETL